MGVRTKVDVSLAVGAENSLDDCLFDRSVSELVDTLEDSVSSTGTLAASENSRQLDLGDIQEVRLVYIEADGELEVYFGGTLATAPIIDGSGGTFPTTFVGGETFDFDVDATNVPVAFTSAAQTAQDAANEINAALALLGIEPVASVFGGELRLTNPNTGSARSLTINAGTGLATLGFTALATAVGVDSIPNTSPHRLQRLASSGSSQLSTLKAYLLATINATAVFISNPDTVNSVRYRWCAVGDLVT